MKYPITASFFKSLLLGALWAVAVYLLLQVFMPQLAGSALDRILWGNAVSPVILGVFFAAVTLLFGKWLRIGKQLRLNRQFRTDVAPALFDAEVQLEQVVQRPRRFQDNLLAQRWRIWQLLKGRDNNTALERDIAQWEAELLTNSYSGARFLVWSLPIIGFIGTVWGIGLSIAFFSDTMSSSQAGASVSSLLQQNIPLVTGGLSTAFDTTLLALVLSVPATGLLVLIEQRERGLLLVTDTDWRELLVHHQRKDTDASQLDIDLQAGKIEAHAQALNESMRDLQEEIFERFEQQGSVRRDQ